MFAQGGYPGFAGVAGSALPQARLGHPAAQEGLLGGSSSQHPGSNLYSGGSCNLYRLKVINLPDALSERSLVELFSRAGTVYEARIVHDKATGLPVGYGYVSYGSKEDADRAISYFDDQLQLEGSVGRLSVYYAKKQHSLKESSPARNAKLYFCGTPPGCKREDIVAMFSAYGRVRHLQVYMDSMGTLSSGTVTMFTAGEAIAAMTALDGVIPQDGTAPLKVTWAQLTTTKRVGMPSGAKAGYTLVYSNIPPTVAPADLIPAFEAFGTVLQVIPFAQRREGPRNCRGCGLVVMATEQEAAAAMAGLHGVTKWPGSERALSVQPYTAANDRSAGISAVAAGRMLQQVGTNSSASSSSGSLARFSGGGGGLGMPLSSAGYGLAPPMGLAGGVSMAPASHLMPLQGGSPLAPSAAAGAVDATEALVANLPPTWSENELLQLLQPYGAVLQLQLARNPTTGASLGSATVLFYSSSSAAAAVQGLNGTMVTGHAGDAPRVLLVQTILPPVHQQQQQQGGMNRYGALGPSPLSMQNPYMAAAAGMVTSNAGGSSSSAMTDYFGRGLAGMGAGMGREQMGGLQMSQQHAAAAGLLRQGGQQLLHLDGLWGGGATAAAARQLDGMGSLGQGPLGFLSMSAPQVTEAWPAGNASSGSGLQGLPQQLNLQAALSQPSPASSSAQQQQQQLGAPSSQGFTNMASLVAAALPAAAAASASTAGAGLITGGSGSSPVMAMAGAGASRASW